MIMNRFGDFSLIAGIILILICCESVDHAAAEAMTESVSELSTRPMKLL